VESYLDFSPAWEQERFMLSSATGARDSEKALNFLEERHSESLWVWEVAMMNQSKFKAFMLIAVFSCSAPLLGDHWEQPSFPGSLLLPSGDLVETEAEHDS
jgi:hypothetical protein